MVTSPYNGYLTLKFLRSFASVGVYVCYKGSTYDRFYVVSSFISIKGLLASYCVFTDFHKSF